jgi:anti-sigma factor RsiW
MMTDDDTMPETELDAYIDDQLDAAARLRVETYLARHPLDAARVMADLGMRTTLKLALTASDATAARPQTREAARRLSAGLENRRVWRGLQRVAAIAILVSAGWYANQSFAPFGSGEVNASVPPPDFVDQAMRAHQAAVLRDAMPSQPAGRSYNREDIRAATAIVMPTLPAEWQALDTQIFPSDYGPSVETRIRKADGEMISLFAVRPGHFAVEAVHDLSLKGGEAAWWQIGEVAYAVVSTNPQAGLQDEAELLKNTLY